MAGKRDITLNVGYNVDDKQLKNSVSELRQSLQEIGKLNIGNFSGAQQDLMQVKDTAILVQQALKEAFNVKLDSINVEKFNQKLSESGLDLNKIQSDFSKIGVKGQTAFNQLATSVLTSNLQLKQTHSLLDRMGTTMMNTLKWGISSSIFNSLTSSVQQAFSYVQSLDSALTDIRIVTGESTQQMSNFADQANRAAQQLGRSTMDYSKAALTFYQQGLGEEDVQARTQATLMAQNITGAGSQMADYLTAVWNGYKVANQEAELYVDKLAAVADSSASNMSQLAVAMSKVASTANALGVPVDSLNAQIATIVATTRQAPESVGNALKTIYSRINDIATGADGAQVSLGNYSQKMAQLGFNVLDASGHLRDTGDVIEQIGGKWASLSKQQQIYLARTMAGQRQYNNLIALFDNWGRYTDLVTVSMESQGTTIEKNSRYMDSLAAHMNQLGAAGERLKSSLIDSDSFKGLIDAGTGVVGFMANFIQSIGGGGNALLGLGSIATSVFSGVISREINGVINNFKAASSNAKILADDIKLTEQFGKKSGLSSNAVNSMVELKKQAQQYYGFLSTQQINEFQRLVKNVGQYQTAAQKYKQMAAVAQQFADRDNLTFGEETGLDQAGWVQTAEKSLQAAAASFNKFDQQNQKYAENVKRVFDTIKQSLGSELSEAFGLEELAAKFEKGQISAKELQDAARGVVQTVKETDPDQLEKLKQKYSDAEWAAKQAKKAAQDYLKQINQMSTVQAFTKTVAGIGQVTSGINSLRNLTKIWQNETLSAGQKILQSLTSFSSGFGMLISGFSNITPGISKLFSMVSVGTSNVTKIIAEATSETGTLSGALAAAGTSAAGLAGAIASVVAPIAVLAGLIWVFDHFTTSAKEAAASIKQMDKAALQATESYNKTKQGVNSLREIKDQYNSLAEKAGQYGQKVSNLTDEEKQRYAQLRNQIAEIVPAWKLGEDAKGDAVIATNKLLDQQIDKLNQINEKEMAKAYSQENFDKYTEAVDIVQGNSGFEAQLADPFTAYIQTGGLTNITKSLIKPLKDADAISDDLSKNLTQISDKLLKGQQLSEKELSELKHAIQDLPDIALNPKVDEKDFNNYKQLLLDISGLTERITKQKVDLSNLIEIEPFSRQQRNWVLNAAIFDSDAGERLRETGSDLGLNLVQGYEKYLEDSDFLTGSLTERMKAAEKLTQNFSNNLAALLEQDGGQQKLKQIMDFQIDPNLSTAEAKQAVVDFKASLVETFGSNNYALVSLLDMLGLTPEKIDDEATNAVNQISNAFSKSGKTLGDPGVKLLKEQLEKLPIETLRNIPTLIKQIDFSDPNISAQNLINTILRMQAQIEQASKKAAIAKADEGMGAVVSSYSNNETLNEDELGIVQSTIQTLLTDYDQFLQKQPELNDQLLKWSQILNDSALQGTQDYALALAGLNNIVSQINFSNIAEQANNAAADLSNTFDQIFNKEDNFIKIGLNLDEEELNRIEESVDQFLSAERSLRIQIESNVKQQYQQISGIFNNISTGLSYIGQDFTVTGDKAIELANTFPGILENYQYLANGVIKLDTDKAKQIIANSKQVAIQDSKSAIARIEAQQEQLRARAAAEREVARVAGQMLEKIKKGQKITAQDRANLSTKLAKVKKLDADWAAQQEETASSNAVNTISEDYTVLQNNAKGSYGALIQFSHEWAQAVIADAQEAKAAMQAVTNQNAPMPSYSGGKKNGINTSNYQQAKSVHNSGRYEDRWGMDQGDITTYSSGINWDDETKGLSEAIQALKEANQKAAEGHEAAANAMDGYKAALEASANQLDEGFDNVLAGRTAGDDGSKSGSGGKSGSGSGSGKSSTPKEQQEKQAEWKQGVQLEQPQLIQPEDVDPYYEINLQLEQQQKLIKELNQLEKKSYGKGKLKVLAQEKQAQEELIRLEEEKAEIAKNQANQQLGLLQTQFGAENIQLRADGHIANLDQLLNQANADWQQANNKYAAAVNQARQQYNNYISYYNSLSGAQQQAQKNNLKIQQDNMKRAQQAAKQTLEIDKKTYQNRKKYIQQYNKYITDRIASEDNVKQMNKKLSQLEITGLKVVVDLSIDEGNFQRKWIDFQKKFIKKIDKNDLSGLSNNALQEAMSYFASGQLASTQATVDKIRAQITKMEQGVQSEVYVDDLARARQDLKKYQQTLMKSLQSIQALNQQINANYLKSLDNVMDKMEDHIKQYQRVKDLLNNNAKIVELLYGDAAAPVLKAYSQQTSQINDTVLQNLVNQRDYWLQQMREAEKSGNQQVYDIALKNYNKLTDEIDSNLQKALKERAEQFEKDLKTIVDDLGYQLTNGLGWQGAEDQWDMINKYDDSFLDPVQSKRGIKQIERLYENAASDLNGNPAVQRQFNKFMDQELKKLRQKDKLTEYDLKRAKAALQVQKARYALELSRDSKTSMRLRRDSQGNYTYQYVADEQKLSDLQAQLEDAQADLYDLDKAQYKKTLEDIYQTEKEFINKRTELYNKMEQAAREGNTKLADSYAEQIKNLEKWYNGLNAGQQESLQNITGNLAASANAIMMTDIDTSNFDKAQNFIQNIVPQASSTYKDFANYLIGEGGLIPASAQAINKIADTTAEYWEKQYATMEKAKKENEDLLGVVENGVFSDTDIQFASSLTDSTEKAIQAAKDQTDALKELCIQIGQLMDRLEKEGYLKSLIAGANTYMTGDAAVDAQGNIILGEGAKGKAAADEELGIEKTEMDPQLQSFCDSLNEEAKALDAAAQKLKKFAEGDIAIAPSTTKGIALVEGSSSEGAAAIPDQVVASATLEAAQAEAVKVQQAMENALKEAQASGILNPSQVDDILNQTKSMLAMMGISSSLEGVSENGRINRLLDYLQARQQALQQQVHIQANFPNVSGTREIEQAFNNLVNLASQYASRTRD